MSKDMISYRDLECELITVNSKKYLIIDENLSKENIYEKAKKYGFTKENNKWRLEVYNLYEDYNLDEGTLYSESIGKFILSDSEVIYAFQMDGCGFSSRYWQITYEEYINYKNWKDNNVFIRDIVNERPYLEPYFSRNDLFKIAKQNEGEGYKEYYLEYLQKPIETIGVLIKEKEDKLLKFFQSLYINLAKVDIDKLNNINHANLYYKGYISTWEWDRECWIDTLDFKEGYNGKIIASREFRDNKVEEYLKEERNALKSIILEIDKKDFINAIDKAMVLAQKNINNDFNINFMNTVKENYALAKKQLIESGEINKDVTGGSRAYLYNCFSGELTNKENELLKAMDLVDERIKRLMDNRKKYNVQQNDDGQQHISKDDFLNSYYNKN